MNFTGINNLDELIGRTDADTFFQDRTVKGSSTVKVRIDHYQWLKESQLLVEPNVIEEGTVEYTEPFKPGRNWEPMEIQQFGSAHGQGVIWMPTYKMDKLIDLHLIYESRLIRGRSFTPDPNKTVQKDEPFKPITYITIGSNFSTPPIAEDLEEEIWPDVV